MTQFTAYRLTRALRAWASSAIVCLCVASACAAQSPTESAFTTTTNDQFDVIDEPHSAVPVPGSFTLEQQNVDAGSIVVLVQSPLPPYELITLVENVHYAVIPAGNFFQIQIFALPPQFVVPGTYDFSVSYSLACTGDCGSDGFVTVDELITMVNIALGNIPMAMCKAGDANGDEHITVDEIITGVDHALNGCVTPVSLELERTAGAASSILVALVTLLTDIPVFGGDSGAAAVSAGGRAAALEPCQDGGTLDVSCQASGGNSTLTTSWSNCRIRDDVTGVVATSDGTFVMVVASGDVCTTGVIPSNVHTMTHFTSFSTTYTDGSGTLITQVSLPDLWETVDPSGSGCAGPNGTFALNGSFAVTTPVLDINLSGTANSLSMQTTSSGVPCAADVITNGSLFLTDGANDRRFLASFAGTHARFQPGPNDSILGSLDGPLDLSCVGGMTLTTETPLTLPGGGCPTGGRLSVDFEDGTSGRIHFTSSGGVEFDYNADGSVDNTVSSCRDSSISQCR